MFINSHRHISHGLSDVIITARIVPFIDHIPSPNVFVFKVEKICLVCQRTILVYLNRVKFGDKGFAKIFISIGVREFDENLPTLFKKKTIHWGLNQLSSSDESLTNLFTV